MYVFNYFLFTEIAVQSPPTPPPPQMMQYFSLNQECQNGTQVKLKVFKIWLQ